MKLKNRYFGYTIYKDPSDVPGHYVVRGWDIDDGLTIPAPDAIAIEISDGSLKVLRESLTEMGLICLGRRDGDDPVILEVWI